MSPTKEERRCVVVCCSVLQCVAVCCSVLQCAAVYCSARSNVTYILMTDARSFATWHVALHSAITPDDDDCFYYCPGRNNVTY